MDKDLQTALSRAAHEREWAPARSTHATPMVDRSQSAYSETRLIIGQDGQVIRMGCHMDGAQKDLRIPTWLRRAAQ
jgi:hypothetical protein